MARYLVALVAVVSLGSVCRVQAEILIGEQEVAPRRPAVQSAHSDIVFVGTVTAVERDEVEVPPSPGSSQGVGYRVAVVRIDDGLSDVGGQTHVKVGFSPSTGETATDYAVKEGATGVFFLTRHRSGSFYIFTNSTPIIETGEKTYKEDLALVKKTMGVIADPVKALKVADAKDRYFAAAVLVQKYRTPPMGSPGQAVAVAADESKLILQAIADADWAGEWKDVPAPYQTFVTLGLTAADKWTPAPLNDNGDLPAHTKEEFKKWVAGDGAKYQVKKYVAK